MKIVGIRREFILFVFPALLEFYAAFFKNFRKIYYIFDVKNIVKSFSHFRAVFGQDAAQEKCFQIAGFAAFVPLFFLSKNPVNG